MLLVRRNGTLPPSACCAYLANGFNLPLEAALLLQKNLGHSPSIWPSLSVFRGLKFTLKRVVCIMAPWPEPQRALMQYEVTATDDGSLAEIL